jgi:hypothetical protein
MPVKRTKAKARLPKLPSHLRAPAERLLELEEAHTSAIRGRDQSFYKDGRHEELVTIAPVISAALALEPWNYPHTDAIRAALGAGQSDD